MGCERHIFVDVVQGDSRQGQSDARNVGLLALVLRHHAKEAHCLVRKVRVVTDDENVDRIRLVVVCDRMFDFVRQAVDIKRPQDLLQDLSADLIWAKAVDADGGIVIDELARRDHSARTKDDRGPVDAPDVHVVEGGLGVVGVDSLAGHRECD